MKKCTAFLLTLSASLLASCSLGTGSAEQYYRVDFYTDYDGIVYDAASLSTSSATLAGHCYVRKGAETRIASLTTPEKDAGGNVIAYKTSKQAAVTGHEWVFDSWVGFYADGTAIDINAINSDCAVFAHFNSETLNYRVTFTARGKKYLSQTYAYGTKLSDTFVLNGDAYGDGTDSVPVSPSYDPDGKGLTPYYEQWDFAGWACTPKDADGNGSKELDGGAVKLYSTAEALNRIVESDVDFTADATDGFEKTDASYTVTFTNSDPDVTFLDSASDPIDLSLGLTASVTYGEPVDLSNVLYAGNPESASVSKQSDAIYEYALTGWTGYYGTTSDVPESIRGKKVDADHILYDCTLSPVFATSLRTYDVRFYDSDGVSLINSDSVHYGGAANIPTPTDVPGKTFTGLWMDIDSGSYRDSSDLGSVTADMNLRAVFVDTEKNYATTVHASDGNDYAAEFRYEYVIGSRGYALMNLDLPSTADWDEVTIDLSASDFASSSFFDADFPLVEIRSFNKGVAGGVPEADCHAVASIDFAGAPLSSVRSIASNAFAGMNRIVLLDLQATSVKEFASHCFGSMLRLESLVLPATMESIGTYAVYDTKVSTITVKGYADEASASASIDFADRWNYKSVSSSATVVYSL